MCYIVFISRIQRPLRPASVFSMMMMMMIHYGDLYPYIDPSPRRDLELEFAHRRKEVKQSNNTVGSCFANKLVYVTISSLYISVSDESKVLLSRELYILFQTSHSAF